MEEMLTNRVKGERGQRYYAQLRAQYVQKHAKEPGASHVGLMIGAADAEECREACEGDVAKRGAVVEVRNGRQVFKKPNPSVAQITKMSEWQRKLCDALKLMPVAVKEADGGAQGTEGAADEFEEFTKPSP